MKDLFLRLIRAYSKNNSHYYDFASARIPTNFACLGDARMGMYPGTEVKFLVCLTFSRYAVVNPCFGQGVTKAMYDITYLNSTLANLVPPWSTDLPTNFSREFLKRATPTARGIYDLNRMLDYQFNTTIPQAGESLAHGKWFRKYWIGLLRVCNRVCGLLRKRCITSRLFTLWLA